MASDRKDQRPSSANPMWGGRFTQGPSEIMAQINASVDFDCRLARDDIRGSQAHANMLAKRGVISEAENAAIQEGLIRIRDEIEAGVFNFDSALEDVHMNIESRLRQLIGEPAGVLHTARSRNDQVATDMRLWLRDQIDTLDAAFRDLQDALIDKAEVHAAAIMPGLTHLQPAQPVTLGHHLLAYVEMFGRDRGRLADCRQRMNESPLGSAALAGTTYPIDRKQTAYDLGFDRPTSNSMDAVSDRDFALEFLATAVTAALHLSRLAEELVYWTGVSVGFVRLPDSLTTGSSIMPQKRNADAAELVRGKTGRVIGSFVTLATMLKALPLTYAKDMQEDKEPVFDTVDTLLLTIPATTAMIANMEIDKQTMYAATARGHLTATDLADWLVQQGQMTFREAHHAVGKVVDTADQRGVDIADLSGDTIRELIPEFHADPKEVLTVDAAVANRSSAGGTAPQQVIEAVRLARERYLT